MVFIDNIKGDILKMEEELENLKISVQYDELQEKIKELEKETSGEDFWVNGDNSQKVLREIKEYKSTVEAFDLLRANYEDLQTMVEIAQEEQEESLIEEINNALSQLKNQLEEQKLAALLYQEYDSHNAILTFHAGAGGTEAQDWVEMLYRMYTRYAARHHYKVKILDYLNGDEAGIKSASILIEGHNAYGYLKGESGVHRLVRISPFDSSGRRHTSFASLEVMPEIESDSEVEISSDELKIDTYRSGGAGGQHVNTTDSAVRITHIPTGIVVSCQNERSQHQNKEVAMKMLMAKLAQIKEQENLEKISDIKGEQKKIEWGSQIRSYVFMPYTMVKDHRTDYEKGNVSAVMDGEIDEFINAYLQFKNKGN